MMEEKDCSGSSVVCNIDSSTSVRLSVVSDTMLMCEIVKVGYPTTSASTIALTRTPVSSTPTTTASNGLASAADTSRTIIPFSSVSPRVFSKPSWKYYVVKDILYVHLSLSNGSWYVMVTPNLAVIAVGKLITSATYLEHLYGPKPIKAPPKRASHNLSEIRKMTDDADFHIECLDNVRIPVHSLVLKTYWPFFRTMMQNNCAESNEKVLELDYPADWIEAMVSFIYGQDVEMSFEQATGLIEVAEKYQLLELANMATEEIVGSPKDSITLEAALTGWKRAFKAQNDIVMTFLAGQIATKQSQFGQSDKEKAAFSQLSTEEALGLYFDTLKISTLKK